ncbi:MAG: PhnD/SsuA/transferrin family substrate-binding protein, partial [Halothece sp.]
KPEKLRFTVTDLQKLEELERDFDPFRTMLSEILEIPIEFAPQESYVAAASALQLDQLDLALAGPSEYVVINARTQAIPVVAITRPEYYAVLVVPADSKIQSVEQLKGKTIAMKNVGSSSGHLGPTKLLVDAQLDPISDLKIEMLGREGSCEALLNKEVAAWGGSYTDYLECLETGNVPESQFPILVKGRKLPADLILASRQLNPQFVDWMRDRMVENQDTLIQAIVDAEVTNKYAESEIVAAQDSDYNLIREVYQVIGEKF